MLGLWWTLEAGQGPTAILTTKRFLYKEMSLRCDGGHPHCLLEGSAPGFGRRTQYLEDYQPGLVAVPSACLMFDEAPTITDFIGGVNEEKEQMSGIVQLLTENKAEAVRTVQRLHRNLGHPDNKKRTELLASRGASETVLEVARKFHCVACLRYHKPNSPSPAQASTFTTFHEILQAYVLWIKLGEKKIPILSMVDVATKFQAASVIYGERTQDFLHALERGWLRHFGCPQVLVTDEGRGWALMRCSIGLRAWTSNIGWLLDKLILVSAWLKGDMLSFGKLWRSTWLTSTWPPLMAFAKHPAECLKFFGASEDNGQLDAPRRWYLEAVRRLRALGLRQHVLDPCTFLIMLVQQEKLRNPDPPSWVPKDYAEWSAFMWTTCWALVTRTRGLQQARCWRTSENLLVPWVEGWLQLGVLWCQHW